MLLPPRRQRNNERKLIQLNKDGEDIHNKDDQDIQITPNNASILWVDRHLRHRTAETHTTTRGEGAKRRTTHDENPATQQQQQRQHVQHTALQPPRKLKWTGCAHYNFFSIFAFNDK